MDTFLTILNNANEIMKQYNPKAKFLEFSRDFSRLDTPYLFTFVADGTGFLLKYSGTGFVTPPEKVPVPLGVQTIPLLIGLADAQKQVPFAPIKVALCWVLYPGAEPHYAFYSNDKVAYVNAYTGLLNPALTNIQTAPVEMPIETNVPLQVR